MSQPPADHAGHPATEPATLDDTATSEHVGHDAHAAEAGEHGHGEALGPIDWAAYGAGVLGILVGLGTAFAFAVATNRLG